MVLTVSKSKGNHPVTQVVRTVFGTRLNWVVDMQLRGKECAAQLQADALAELNAGRPKLLEFVRKHRHDLVDQLDLIWELVEAPKRLVRMCTLRRDVLMDAAMVHSGMSQALGICANAHGNCADLYNSILSYQGLPTWDFCHAIFETLTAGRSKGNDLMIVGGQYCGKTAIAQPAGDIFKTIPKLESDYFCPIQNMRGHELFVWQ